MKLKNFSPIVISLLVGAAIGYCFSTGGEAPKAEPEKAEAPEAATASDDAAEKELRILRARVKELAEALARKSAEAEATAEKVAEAQPPEGGRPNFDPRAAMERLKTEDPARYAQITNNMAQFRQHRLERAQSKIDFLAAIDTSRMSPTDRKTHADLQEMIAQREALEDKMKGIMDMTHEERRALFEEMHKADEKIRELSLAERDILLGQTVSILGFEGEDAAEVVETVKGIYEATESFSPGFRPARGRGPGGPRRRGP